MRCNDEWKCVFLFLELRAVSSLILNHGTSVERVYLFSKLLAKTNSKPEKLDIHP